MSQSILHIGGIGDIGAMNVTDKLQDDKGDFRNGQVRIDTRRYDVTFRDGKADVSRSFYGFTGWIMSLFVGKKTTTALAIEKKLNDVITGADKDTAFGKNSFQIISSNRAKLNEILAESGGKKVIEVADYGLKPNRDLVKNSKLVAGINAELLDEDEEAPRKINFNKIDGYNTVVGIVPGALDARNLPATLQKIAGGKLVIDDKIKPRSQYGLQRVKDWRSFLARPENVKKLNIPAKLYGYLHLDPGLVTEKQTGWKAAFSADKDRALKQFILKNLPYSFRNVSEESVDLVAQKIKEYVEIFHMEDSPEKTRKLDEFFKKENWFGPEDQALLNERIEEYGEEDGREMFEGNPLESRQLYGLFTNVFVVSTFRQASKLGLDFFLEQGVPVMFQYADYNGKSLKGREDEFRKENYWTQGCDAVKDKGVGGSAITHSELRRVFRLLERPGGKELNVKFAEGGRN